MQYVGFLMTRLICIMLLLYQCIFVQTSHACVVYVMLCICKYVLCYGPVASISLIKNYYYYYMLDELEWPFLEARREQSSLTFFYKIHSGTVSLDKDKYLIPAPNLQRTRSSNDSQYIR